MAKQTDNWLIFALVFLLGGALPLSAWFLLQSMTRDKVADIKNQQIDQKLKQLDELAHKLKEERKSHVGKENPHSERARNPD